MLIKNVIHIAFYTDKMDEMLAFYTEKLGGELKILTRYGTYLDRDDRPEQQAIARKDPRRIFNAYIEIAPGQSIELFPAVEKQKPHPSFNEMKGYSHFALETDDIFGLHEELLKRGMETIMPISKGPSETYQMWFRDPDDNWFEIMQYTENSYQVKGHVEK